MKQIRCAIYTRKSSEEGLEQDFNSLDVQHAACSAPIRDHAFFSRRFSSVRSATHSFRFRASRRRSCTSPVVAARAVSPAKRRLPASMKG